jgi:hypothetical protein
MRITLSLCLALLSTPALAGLGVPELPAEIMATLSAQWPGFLLQESEREGENWEVELRAADGTEHEVLLDPSGAVLLAFAKAEEQEIPVAELPAAVSAAVLAGWPGASLLEAERKGTAFEVELRSGAGERIEALFAADGALIASAAEGEDEADDDEED